MPAKVNKHGLSRDIPSPTKRAIRQECGFGCVVCGSTIYQYEHIIPEWHEAKEHRCSQIALLCGTCHDHVTRGFWPKEKIRLARLNPYCVQTGFARTYLGGADPGTGFTVSLGNCNFVRPRTVLRVFGDDLLGIRAPEAPGGPLRLSGHFYDGLGKLSLEIVDNEYRAMSQNWDIETGQGTVLIRSDRRQIALELAILGANHVAVRRLDMFHAGLHVKAGTQGITLTLKEETHLSFNGTVVEPECAVEIRRDM